MKKDNLTQIKNLAFVDGQNLYMNTAKKEINPWKVDLARFRIYLDDADIKNKIGKKAT